MVKIVASLMYNLHIDYETIMNTPFRPMSMVLMTINNMMSETDKPAELNDNWAQSVVTQVQNQYDL